MARTDPRPNYGAKRRVRRDGYVDLYRPGHSLARRDGYVMEHRFMAWEAGLFSDPALQVHHVNEVRDDNRLENFEIKDIAGHARDHAWERGTITNQHGTFPVLAHGAAAYKRGCRCKVCTAGNTEVCREYRRRRLGLR